MSLSSYSNNPDYDSSEVDEQRTFSTINIGPQYYRRHSLKAHHVSKAGPIVSWQVMFLVCAALLIGGVVAYYVKSGRDQQTNQVLIAQKQALADLKQKITQKQKRLAELQWIKNDLESKLKEQRVAEANTGLQSKIDVQNKMEVENNTIEAVDEGSDPCVPVDLLYTEKEYSDLPIDPLRMNAHGQRIAEVLYKDLPTINRRDGFMKQRFDFVSHQNNFPSIFLAKYNLVKSKEQLSKAIEDNQKDWLRLETKFQLSKLKEELPMCVVVPSYNNNANFRIEYSLNSVFTQNYTNYKVVIINDASTDGSEQVYRNYFSFYAIDKQRYVYIQNSKRVTALQNHYFASMKHCSRESIVLNLDGDDELIGRNVLQVFNWAYQTKKAGVIYSNFYWFQQPTTLRYGFTSEYSQNVKKNSLFRSAPMQFSQLRSFRASLISLIDPKDLQDNEGVFFTITCDIALLIPLMQLSCGRVHKIEGEFHYLYNVGTGLSDELQRSRQVAVEHQIRKRKKYECSKDFDELMKK